MKFFSNSIKSKAIWWCIGTYGIAIFFEFIKSLAKMSLDPWFSHHTSFLIVEIIISAVAVEFFIWLLYDCKKKYISDIITTFALLSCMALSAAQFFLYQYRKSINLPVDEYFVTVWATGSLIAITWVTILVRIRTYSNNI